MSEGLVRRGPQSGTGRGAMLAAGCSQTGWEVVRLWMSLEGEWTRLQVDEKECGQGGQRGVRPEVGMEVEGQQESGLGGGVRCPLHTPGTC